MKPPTRARSKRDRQRREGAVMLIVLLILMMATGTAVFALQATSSEQRASTSFADAAWTRTLAESGAMAALSVVEEGHVARGAAAGNLDGRWRNGTGRAAFSLKYGLPTPLEGTVSGASPETIRSIECSEDSAAFAGTMPEGLLGFIAPLHNGAAPFGAYLASYKAPRCRAVYETWAGVATNTNAAAAAIGGPVRVRTRSVITGIGETSIPNDAMDQDGQRALHETVGMARAYFDMMN